MEIQKGNEEASKQIEEEAFCYKEEGGGITSLYLSQRGGIKRYGRGPSVPFGEGAMVGHMSKRGVEGQAILRVVQNSEAGYEETRFQTNHVELRKTSTISIL